MEELVNDRLLQDRSTAEVAQTSSSPSTSAKSVETKRRRQPRKSLNVSGPVQSYHPHLKNFWYPVAFSNDLKDDTMVSQYFPLLLKNKILILLMFDSYICKYHYQLETVMILKHCLSSTNRVK